MLPGVPEARGGGNRYTSAWCVCVCNVRVFVDARVFVRLCVVCVCVCVRAGVRVRMCHASGLEWNEVASFSVGTNTLRVLTYLPSSHKLRPYRKVHWKRSLVPRSESFAIAHFHRTD